jgi:hypothetical protein
MLDQVKLFSFTFRLSFTDSDKLIYRDFNNYFQIEYNYWDCNPKISISAWNDNKIIIRFYKDIEANLIQELLNDNLEIIYSSFKAYEKHKQNQADYVKRLIDLHVEKYNVLL